MKRKLLTLIVLVSIVCPAMGANVKSFCEYGTGVALQLGVGGAIWDQAWGLGPWDWYEGQAKPNVGIINQNVTGILVTTTAGPPSIEDWILRFTFGGQIVLTANESDDPKTIAGQIVGDVDGIFVADVSADRAVVDQEAGTITIVFGAELHDDPDALITVTETTGKFKSIHAVGLWEWYVNGTVTLARIEGMDLQLNILAALGNPALILGAEEEIVLAGSYYRNSP